MNPFPSGSGGIFFGKVGVIHCKFVWNIGIKTDILAESLSALKYLETRTRITKRDVVSLGKSQVMIEALKGNH